MEFLGIDCVSGALEGVAGAFWGANIRAIRINI